MMHGQKNIKLQYSTQLYLLLQVVFVFQYEYTKIMFKQECEVGEGCTSLRY